MNVRDYLRKILIFALLAGFILSTACPSIAAASRQVAVHIDGVPLQFDVAPQLREEKLMLPLRKIFEELGYLVTWEADGKRVALRGPGRMIILYPGNVLYSVNGVVYRASEVPFIEKGRTMVGIDLLKQSAGIKNLVWDEQKGILHLEYLPSRRGEVERDWGIIPDEEGQSYFVEVLLPPGNRVDVGETFEIRISAPLVRGIHSYEIRFFYNPEVIKIKDITNPFFIRQDEFYMKRINNRDGMVQYTLTTLGFPEVIPPRKNLVVIEAIAFRAGAVPFLEGTLQIKMLDNTAGSMPVFLEEKTLYTGPPR
ncbi:MAG: stalk domain-containing protein [Bacillota bacterium]|nr:stalk domain-containing protein [Bacillota bacterium]